MKRQIQPTAAASYLRARLPRLRVRLVSSIRKRRRLARSNDARDCVAEDRRLQMSQYSVQIAFCRGMATKRCAREACGKKANGSASQLQSSASGKTVYPIEELNCLDKASGASRTNPIDRIFEIADLAQRLLSLHNLFDGSEHEELQRLQSNAILRRVSRDLIIVERVRRSQAKLA